MQVKHVVKRNGMLVSYDKNRILNAITKALHSVNAFDVDKLIKYTDEVDKELDKRFDGQTDPTVEQIQDVVESVLMKHKETRAAREYILYREKHKQIRESDKVAKDVIETIDSFFDGHDWKIKENSNVDSTTCGALNLYITNTVTASYVLNKIYSSRVRQVHESGEMHIHDIWQGLNPYCMGNSLEGLLRKGFGGVPNRVQSGPAKHLETVVMQMVNFIKTMQGEFAGAQAFNAVDTLVAPFIKVDNLDYKRVYQCAQMLIFELNALSRHGGQPAFSNLSFDWVPPKDLKDKKALVGGVDADFTYGDCQKEMDMFNKAFLEVMIGGDAMGRVFSFPLPTYNLTKDFNWDSENAELLFTLTAKYGTPYFQNYIGSNLDPLSIRSLCCRLNLDFNQLAKRTGGIWGYGDSTGSIGVITINLNRIGYEAKGNEEAYFKKLDEIMELAKEALETKRKLVTRLLDRGFYPYTKIYLGHFRNHFSTIGILGMDESLTNFMGKSIATREGVDFTKKVLMHMRENLIKFQEETGNLYNLEATPAESTCYRLARLDKEMYSDIYTAGTNETPYLTNSTHLPANIDLGLFNSLEHQSDIQSLYNGGTIFHVYLGERVSSWESCRALVKKIAENTKLPYFTITPTFSICATHGYIKGEQESCPACHGPVEVYSRIVGYFRPTSYWNKGKAQEWKDRNFYDEREESQFVNKDDTCVSTQL